MKKVIAGILAALVVVALGWTHRDQVTARLSCADKIAHQGVTTQVVPGAYQCVDPNTQIMLFYFYGVKSASDFAKYWGVPAQYNPSYSYLGETADGGYTYRLDAYQHPHSSFQPAFEDIKNGNFGAAWGEINGETQGAVSMVMTIYLYPPGSQEAALDGHTYDVSGKLLVIQ